MARKTTSAPFRDAAGKTLEEYTRPSVAIDVAVLTVGPEGLAVLLLKGIDPVDHTWHWSLPGGFVHIGERLSDTVERVLRDKCRIRLAREPEQLHVFDDPKRDPRGWVMSVAHALAVPHEVLDSQIRKRTDLYLATVRRDETTVRLDLPDGQQALPFDHDDIVHKAVTRLRERYDKEPDPDRLLGDTFTFPQLRSLHDAVLGKESGKDSFRRRFIERVEVVGDIVDRSTGGPPAKVYRRKDVEQRPLPDVLPKAWQRHEFDDEDLLKAVAEYASTTTSKPTVEGYRVWAKEHPARPSETLVRKRLSDRLGGWSGILKASGRPHSGRPPRTKGRAPS